MSYRSLVTDLDASNSVERLFRMSPESSTVSLSFNSLKNNRAASAAALNHQVELKFEERAGVAVGAFAAAAAQIAGADEAAIDSAMTNMTGHAEVIAVANGILVAADQDGNILDVRGYDGESEPWELPEVDGKYRVGYISFGIEDAYNGSPLAPVRVDAHSDQLIKKLFKFKNLRDPNL
jgi:hypothetical protein